MAHVIGVGPIGMVDAKFASCLSPCRILCRGHVQTENRDIHATLICTPIEPFLSFSSFLHLPLSFKFCQLKLVLKLKLLLPHFQL